MSSSEDTASCVRRSAGIISDRSTKFRKEGKMVTKQPPTATEERGLNKIGVKVGTYRYTTMDILVIAVIAAVGGVVNAYAVGAWAKFIEAAAGPFGAALDNPFYIFWVIIAALLIPKPGVAIVTSMLAGIIEVLAGPEDGSVS